jgi:hypothetical protein
MNSQNCGDCDCDLIVLFFHWIFVIVLAGVINILSVVESQKYVKLIEIVRVGKSVFDDSV